MTKDEQIAEIINEFDWKKVHRVMVALDWEWEECGGVPDIKRMKCSANRHLDCVWNEAISDNLTDIRIRSGGFVASYSCGYLSLSFCAEHWAVDPPETE